MADVLPAINLPTTGSWAGLCGVRNLTGESGDSGIPTNYTLHNATPLPTGTSIATINSNLSAAAAAGGYRYVQLAAGTFTAAGTITFPYPGRVILRGAVDANGIPTTIFSASVDVRMVGAGLTYPDNYASYFTHRTITSSYARGVSTVTLNGSTTSLAVGQVAWVNASIPGPGSHWVDFPTNSGRNFLQSVEVISKNDGAQQVTFYPPIQLDALPGTVQLSWRSSQNADCVRCGLENIQLTYGAGRTVEMQGTQECWVKNVYTRNCRGEAHFYIMMCHRAEIRHCDSRYNTAGGSNTYGFEILQSSSGLFINNIFWGIPNDGPYDGGQLNVWAYNFGANHIYDPVYWLSQTLFVHGPYVSYCLHEGNWVTNSLNVYNLSIGGKYVSWVRNRVLGDDPDQPKTGPFCVVYYDEFMSHGAIVGNVLGTAGIQAGYKTTHADSAHESIPNAIFGFNTTYNTTSLATIKKNYNTYNGGINAAEVTSDTVANSYLFTSKPSWWGDRPWPWVDPDNFSQSNSIGNFPAGYRYLNNGVDPPPGGGTPPSAPTGFHIVP